MRGSSQGSRQSRVCARSRPRCSPARTGPPWPRTSSPSRRWHRQQRHPPPCAGRPVARGSRPSATWSSRLFGGKVSPATVGLLSELVAQRWAAERDLTDTIERLAVETVLASAEAGGRADQVEDELFRFERIVAGNPDLRDALTNRNGTPQDKAELVGSLLQGKVSAETVRLARQAVLAPRGRRIDRSLEHFLSLAAKRREQLTAVVTSAVPLDELQRHRLAGALQRIYGRHGPAPDRHRREGRRGHPGPDRRRGRRRHRAPQARGSPPAPRRLTRKKPPGVPPDTTEDNPMTFGPSKQTAGPATEEKRSR